MTSGLNHIFKDIFSSIRTYTSRDAKVEVGNDGSGCLVLEAETRRTKITASAFI